MLSTPELATEVDLDLDSPCTLRKVVGDRPVCDQPVEWALRLACCGHVKAVCGRHRDIHASIAPMRLICTVCHALTPPIAARWPI